jgi:endonuclease YncB( thermonuclease family)
VDRDRNGRIIAKCKAGWMDLGAEMVTMGMAVAYLRNSDDYLRNYREARGTGIGIFAGEFVEPEQWRKGERHPVETTGDNLPVQ